MSGEFQPVDGYGLKYFTDTKSFYEGGPCWKLEIYQDGFGGDESFIPLVALRYLFGSLGREPLDTLIGSSVEFTIAGDYGQFDEFLEGDYRTWKVYLLKNNVRIFTGFISPNEITNPFSAGKLQFTFVASDGIAGFDSLRVDNLIFPEPRSLAHSAIVGGLNQTFIDFRPVNFAAEIHESRMDDADLIFSQFLWPENSVWNNGVEAKFTDGVRILNDKLFIKDSITRLVNPFLCRVFLWDDEFWVVRITDLAKNSFTVYKYLPDMTLDETFNLVNDLDIECDMDRPQKTARRVFTEFTSVLKLGVLDYASRGGVYEAKFDVDDWFVVSSGSYQGIYKLRAWDYEKAFPIGQPSSTPTGDTARVQYRSDGLAEGVQIWTTTTTAGTGDQNLSFISLTTNSTGLDIAIAQETANTISISFEFLCDKVSNSFPNTIGGHSVAVMVRIGSSYLFRDTATTFDWTNTPTYCSFAISAERVWDKVDITNIPVPEDGSVEVRLCQLILNSGTRHQYTVIYRNFSIKIEENEALTLNEILTKAVTNNPYVNVHPDYVTHIGDAETNNSTSAIKLNITDFPVSETWSRDGVESLPLMSIICQDLANLKGRTNFRIIGTVHRVDLKPYQSVVFQGRLWMINALDLDIVSNSAQVELFDLGIIPTS